MKKKTLSEIIGQFISTHGKRYDYSKVEYHGVDTPVIIICKNHGEFKQTPYKHCLGRGCARCAGTNLSTTEEFILKAKKKHGDKFDYTMVKYVTAKHKVKIVCPEHGVFYQTPNNHLNGQECYRCRNEKLSKINFKSQNDILSDFEKQHGDKYTYPSKLLSGVHSYIDIKCSQHGIFKQTIDAHSRGNGCPSCANVGPSHGETEVYNFVKYLCHDAVQSDRTVIKPKELDIYVPSRNIAIEYNGVHWHNDLRKDKNAHFEKWQQCKDRGVRLISITDYEWETRRNQVITILKSALGCRHDITLNARQCCVQEIEKVVAKEFLDKYHIQGRTTACTISLGLYHNSELVAVMTFAQGSNRRGLSANYRPWNLTRFATSCSVRGGAGKLFKYATLNYGLDTVESYSANDWFTGAMYPKLGFVKVHNVPPDYRVYHKKSGLRPKSHWQRRHIPTRLLEIESDIVFHPANDERTEWMIEDEVGADRIWDTGKILWRWCKL